jgi:CheY-like chemotaxis protein
VTALLLPGGTDGIEFIARLRADDRTKSVPIIVLTANAWTKERERAEGVGCDAFLSKPCLPDELVRALRRLLVGQVRGKAAKADLGSGRMQRRRKPRL